MTGGVSSGRACRVLVASKVVRCAWSVAANTKGAKPRSRSAVSVDFMEFVFLYRRNDREGRLFSSASVIQVVEIDVLAVAVNPGGNESEPVKLRAGRLVPRRQVLADRFAIEAHRDPP